MILLCRISRLSSIPPWISKAPSRLVSTASGYPPHIGSGLYQEGDRIIASYKDGRKLRHKLLEPLKRGGTSRTGQTKYEIRHDDIIGKPAARLYVHSKNEQGEEGISKWRFTQPTFDQFVSQAPRTVTPIYASYSASIIDLLDIHVYPPQASNLPVTGKQSVEILEAGTGHGGLTIHLARAIAAANPAPPVSGVDDNSDDLEKAWTEWRSSRRAVVHTVEYTKSRSAEASALIQSFRGGVYWPHIDFHSGDVVEWVKKEQEQRDCDRHIDADEGSNNPFLDIVLLDLPDVHKKIEHVINAMKDDAQLLVYVPQITQIAACQTMIERLSLPLVLDQVVELGEGISNGRVWDLRFLKTRAEQKLEQETADSEATYQDDSSVTSESELESPASTGGKPTPVASSDGAFPTMVCRPMVGRFVMGGAFIGLWRKRTKTR